MVIAGVYLATFLIADGLRFQIRKDERYFWPVCLYFSGEFPPSLEQLSGYDVPTTPLSFMVWGQLEHLFQGGIFVGRLLNFVLSFAMICLIGMRHRPADGAPMLAALGLLCCPYYLPLSVHLYTDIFAAFFLLVGYWLAARDQSILASVYLALAIACRQYMLAFPLALAVTELASSLTGDRRRWVKGLAPLAAAGSIFGWIWLFGALGPAPGLEKWIPRYPAPMMEALAIIPQYGCYFLACVGIYFVLPEFVLFRRWREPRALLTAKNAAIALSLLVLFLAFPPTGGGALSRLASLILPGEFARVALYYALALFACVRFARLDAAFWVVLFNFGVMMKAQIAWDKYSLPALVVLWYLKSLRSLDGGPFPLSYSDGYSLNRTATA